MYIYTYTHINAGTEASHKGIQLHDSLYMKFKNRKTISMVKKKRITVSWDEVWVRGKPLDKRYERIF